jgi:sugar-specific transcriptional regulator TrmB
MNNTFNYDEQVQEAADKKSTIVIPNSSTEHAKILIKRMIKDTNKSMKIYSGNLPEIFYEDNGIAEAIKDKARQGVNVQVMIEAENQKVQNSMKDIDNLEVKIANINDKPRQHFSIFDNDKYRLESPHDTKNIDNIFADACFNDPEGVNNLNSYFDIFWNKAQTV